MTFLRKTKRSPDHRLRRSGIAGAAILGAAFALAASAHAQPAPSASSPMSAPPAVTAPSTPWAAENQATMQNMQQAMMDTAGGSSEDEAFVRGMLPHHQGAIDMARTELRYGHDPMLKRLATSIITAQEREIQEMKAWLARHHEGATTMATPAGQPGGPQGDHIGR